MKRFTFLAIFFAMVLSANAQYYMHVWYNDSIITLPVLNVDSITFSTNPSVSPDIPDTPVEPETPDTPAEPSEPETPTNGFENGHEYVDLGLPSGIKWATCNVGANAPEEYGDYFAWGEVEPKEIYDWSTYKWCALTYHSATSYTAYLTKYCTLTSSGHEFFVDNKTLLEAADDAAVVNWGGVWRMPTKEEQDELREQCTWTMTTINGINGYIVTSKINGYTDKSIFLPETGSKEGATYGNLTYGYYWSSSLKAAGPYNAFYILFDSDDKVHCWDFKRSIGLPVRPVCIKSDDMK